MTYSRTGIQLFTLVSAAWIAVGCYTGDRGSLTETISVDLHTPVDPNNIALSPSDAEAQKAIVVVDSVLMQRGFVRSQDKNLQGMAGCVATYVSVDKAGLTSEVLPAVCLRQHGFDIVITELGNRSTHASTNVTTLCRSLKDSLSDQFGLTNVTVK